MIVLLGGRAFLLYFSIAVNRLANKSVAFQSVHQLKPLTLVSQLELKPSPVQSVRYKYINQQLIS